jgi:rhamnogalacturonyl hydrolase YesR
MIVLAAGTALVAIALVAAVRSCWLGSRRRPVDDAYRAWFNAHSRSGEALQVWLDAAPAARPGAYRAYLVELELEEAAAAELELHAVALAA